MLSRNFFQKFIEIKIEIKIFIQIEIFNFEKKNLDQNLEFSILI